MENTHQNREFQGQRRKKKSSGKVFREVYNPERIELLKSIVADHYKQGSRKFYSILIDGETVVAKTSDSRSFDNYKKYLMSNTKTLEVRMYFGNSPSANRHVFQTNNSSVNGLRPEDIQERIDQALAKQKVENELIYLRKELKRKNKKLLKLKEVQKELDEAKQKPNIENILEKSANLFHTIKGNKTPKALQGTPENNAEVEVNVEEEVEETKADKFYNNLLDNYEEKEVIRALKTWEVFTKYPELKDEFVTIVNQKIKKNGKA
jgi:hypothetical protein